MIILNKRKIFICLFTLVSIFAFSPSYAQPAISELLHTLHTSKADTSRCRIYFGIVQFYQHTDLDSAFFYAQQGLAFAKGINDDKGKAMMLSQLGYIVLNESKYNEAQPYFTEALELFKKINKENGIANTYDGLGILNAKKGDYARATDYFLEALKIYEHINNKEGVIGAYIHLGSVNQETNNFNKALEYFNKAQALNEVHPTLDIALTLYNDMGIVYKKMGENDRSIEMFKTGLAQSKSAQYTGKIRFLLLVNAGGVYNILNKKKQSLDCLNEALELARKNGAPEDEATVLANISSLYVDTDPELALSELQQSLDIARNIGQAKIQVDIYDALASLYKKQNNYKEALDATEKKYTLKDSIMNAKRDVEIADLENAYELEQSNHRIDHLTLLNSRNAIRTKLILVISAAIAILLFVVFFYYRHASKYNKQLLAQQKELKKLNRETTEQKEELKELNTVKDKIFSILGHDLRSPLTSITALLRLLEREDNEMNSEYRGFISKLKFQTTVTLDTLDKLLYWGKTTVKGIVYQPQLFDVYPVVKSNINLLAEASAHKCINVYNNIDEDVQVFADILHFDFIVRNLLSNAIKFTPASGSIELTSTVDSNRNIVVFAVHDNGVGMNEEAQQRLFTMEHTSTAGTADEVGTGIGLVLSREFVEKNGGQLCVHSIPGEGSTFYFSLKTSA